MMMQALLALRCMILITFCKGFHPTPILISRSPQRTYSQFKGSQFRRKKIVADNQIKQSSPFLAKSDGDGDDEKLKSFQKDIQEKFKQDREYDGFGILTPIAQTIDEFSGDWALSYADLSPSTPRTIEGQVFLATNVAYAVAGLILGYQGDWVFAGLTELAGVVSFWYHFIQLEFGKDRAEVRLALLTDYFTAGVALITGGYYMADMGISAVPFSALLSGGGAIVCLSLCWVWEVSFCVLLFLMFRLYLSPYLFYCFYLCFLSK